MAIPGENVDGHDFIADAFKRGASFALITEGIARLFSDPRPARAQSLSAESTLDLSAPLCLRVDNTISALQQIARFWRRKLDLRVIGITGSVGKSTTKEMVAEVLGTRYRTLQQSR